MNIHDGKAKDSDVQKYWRLILEAKPYWKFALIAVVMMIASAAFEPLLPALMAPLIDESMIARNPESIVWIPVYIVLVYIARGLTEFLGSVSSQYVAHKTIANLRSKLFAAQVDLPKQTINDDEPGSFTSRIIFNCSQVRQAVSTAWMILVKDSLVIIGLMIFLLYTSWQMSLAIFVIAPVIAHTIKITNRKMRASNQRLQNWMAQLTGFIEDSAHSIDEIKIFSGHQDQIDGFNDLNRSLVKEQMRVVKVQSLVTPVVQILTAISIGGVILVGSNLSAQDLMSPGEFVAYITAMGMLFSPIKRLTGVAAILQQGLAAADSIYETLDSPSDLQVNRNPKPTKFSRAPIKFDALTFRYTNSQDYVFRNFNLDIADQETVSLTGPSGSGKTTLFSLLAGFIKPTDGSIYINNQNLDSMPLSLLRDQISLVPQTSNLFNTSILHNVTIGNPTATEEEIREALYLANALEFVESLPDKWLTTVGPRGMNLSGGQRQRVNIARAFLKDAPILLLDEPTSALDKKNRDAVLMGLENLMRNRTTIIISHQPETLLSIDRTFLIKQGQLIDSTESDIRADIVLSDRSSNPQ